MPIEPIEFSVGSAKLRHTPLPALVLVREHGELIKRADAGALDLLALQLTPSDQERLVRFEPSSVFTAIKAFALFIGEDDLSVVAVKYLKIGNVEICADVGGQPRWLPLTDEANLALLDDPFHVYDAIAPVLRGLFAPLERALRHSKGEASEQVSGNTSSSPSETTSHAAPS